MSRPLVHISPAQMRALHAAARARRLTHEDLGAFAFQRYGVRSLKDLSVTQAHALLDLINEDRPESRPARAATRTAPGAIRLASSRQRNQIAALFDQLGWDAERCRGWLRKRHAIDDLERGALSTATASAAITQLTLAARKDAAAKQSERSPNDATSATDSDGGAVRRGRRR